jgi:hypothetical protein
MTGSLDASAAYAGEVARLLWPEPWEAPYVTRGRHRAGLGHRDAYLFPSERRPRMLVPADIPQSATMIRRLGTGRPALARPVRSLLERSVRSPGFSWAGWPMMRVQGADSGADSIERHLAECLGTDVRVGVLLGTRRVNQKPVLQVFRLDGTTLGYAKVGHNDLTAELVRREADALTTVGSHLPRSFRLPSLLHHGRWAGLEVLVVSPLTTSPREAVTRTARLSATRELAGLAGTARRPLADSEFWSRLCGTAVLLADAPAAHRLHAGIRMIEDHHGAALVSLGGWHGDWGHWNMGMADGILQVWDWERYDPAVPVGFDPVHFAAQSVRPGERGARRQEAAFLGSVPVRLAELGVKPDQHDLTLQLYLLEIATRYVAMLAFGANPPLQRRTSWVLSLLERQLESPLSGSSKGRS